MKAAEEYLIRARLWARPRTTTKKAAIRQERKTCKVQIAEMQSGGKVRFKKENSHPSEANRKEHKLQQARWRAGEGRINSKNKDIKANDQPFYEAFKRRRPGGKAATGQGTGSSWGMHRAPLNYCSARACVVRGARKSLAGRGWGGAMLFGCEGEAMSWRWWGHQRALQSKKLCSITGETDGPHWQVLQQPKKAADRDLHPLPMITEGAAPRPPSLGAESSRLTSPGRMWHSGKNQCNSGIRANGGRLKSYGVLGRRPGNHG